MAAVVPFETGIQIFLLGSLLALPPVAFRPRVARSSAA